MKIINTIVLQLKNIWIQIIHITANITGLQEYDVQILLRGIIGYGILLTIIGTIHRKLLKHHKNILKKLIFSYDMIRYQLAKIQYENPLIQNTPGIHKILQSNHKNYIDHYQYIKQEIEMIEKNLNQSIISIDQRKNIKKQEKKRKILTILIQIIGRFISIITLGIYKLFR